MAAIAKKVGFVGETLTDGAATAQAVTDKIRAAAGALDAGDTFLLTYAGHGAQIPDATGDDEDAKDETWVLYDRMLLDDELYALWGEFRPGVRIAVFSDSCHSGTVVREVPIAAIAPLLRVPRSRFVFVACRATSLKVISKSSSRCTYRSSATW